MVETAIGVLLGGIVSWMIAEWYHRRQKSVNPTGRLKEVRKKLNDLKKLVEKREDEVLEEKVDEIREIILETHLDILHSLLPLHLSAHAVRRARDAADDEELEKALRNAVPQLVDFDDRLSHIRDELLGLQGEIALEEEAPKS